MTLNELMFEFCNFGEISNFSNGPGNSKILEFPDIRCCRAAYENSLLNSKYRVERVELPSKLVRLGCSLYRFLNSVADRQRQAPDRFQWWDPSKSVNLDKLDLNRNSGGFGDLSTGSNLQSENTLLSGGVNEPQFDPLALSNPNTFDQLLGENSLDGHDVLDEHRNELLEQRFDSAESLNKRLMSRGSHPHHQSLARGEVKKKTLSTEFLINLEAVRNGLDTRTSLMIRNIPNKYEQKMVLEEINVYFERKYDFFYLPIDFRNRCNVGYAFINFIDPRDIESFYQMFNDRKWSRFNSEKVCQISYARIQGKAKLINRFQNSSLMEKEEECRPLVFHSTGLEKGTLAEFPSAAPV
jgi:hypothetical protein